AQHGPDQPELRRLQGFICVDVALRDHRVFRLGGRGRPAGRLPARGRHAVTERAGHHEDEVDARQHDKRLRHTHRFGRRKQLHQAISQRGADHCAATEAHDGHAGGHATLVREPLDERRHGRDVAQPQADPANHARPHPQQPQLVHLDAERGNQQSAAPAHGRDDAGLAGANALKPAAPHGSGCAQEHEEQRKHPAKAGDAPVAGGGEQLGDQRDVGAAGERLRDAQRAAKRQPEDRETVGHADAQMDGQRGRRNQPAVEANRGD
ncbi:hypothetical protein COLO4_00719, partial [Corchorus olitorius]